MPRVMTPLAISAYTATSALGVGNDAHRKALAGQRGGLRRNDFSHSPLSCWIGRVDAIESSPLPDPAADWDCRNHRLAWLGLGADDFTGAVTSARQRYGSGRVAVLLGTSTGSVGATEDGYRRRDEHGRLPLDRRAPQLHSLHSLSAFVAAMLELDGPCLTVSTACSSSARVFAIGARLLQLGLIDAAVVGGVDSLCESVLFGFNALELVADTPCRPFDARRRGLSIGEAAGFALLERAAAAPHAPRLLGYGESSDAWHMSAPHPEGRGAERAVREALARAGRGPDEVDYVNLHGTATRHNDAVEAALVARLFAATTRASSTKGYTGHALGAAGILEAVISLLALADSHVPGTLGCEQPDPACGPQLALAGEARTLRVALSNSFGFGGNNACLVLARAETPT